MSIRDTDHAPVYEWLNQAAAGAFAENRKARPRRRGGSSGAAPLVPAEAPGEPMDEMAFSAWGGYGTGWWGGRLRTILPGSDYDYESAAGHLHLNSAVAACLRVLKINFPQPRLEVRERTTDGTVAQPIPRHPLVELINRPNRYYDRYAFLGAFVLSAIVDGNAFAIKVRSRAGIPVELWWVPHWTMRPCWPPDGQTYISHYQYQPWSSGHIYKVPIEDVIHYRHGGLDPLNERLGISDLKAGLRSICGINEADGYTAAILRNGGIPAVVIKPTAKEGPYPDRDQAGQMKEDYRLLTTGERRGEPFIPLGPFDVVPIGFTPEQLALDTIPSRLEDQICALIGVNAMVAGLTSGAAHKTYNNVQESRRALYEDLIYPMQDALATCLETQLLGDVGIGNPQAEEVGWDYSAIPCLQEDQDRIWARYGDAYQKHRIITRAQAKEGVGLPTDDTDEVYATGQGTEAASLPPAITTREPATPGILDGATGERTDVPARNTPAAGPDGAASGEPATDPEVDGDAKGAKGGAAPPGPFSAGAKSANTGHIPTADELLAAALDRTGLADTYAAGTLSDAERRRVLHDLRLASREWLGAEAARVLAETEPESKGLGDAIRSKLGGLFDRAKTFVKNALTAGALTMFGPGELTENELDGVERNHAEQVEYLDRFKAKINAGEIDTVPKVVANFKLYGGCVWTAGINLAREAVIAGSGSPAEESRVHGGSDEPCPDCSGEIAKGWVPVGTLKPIGVSACGGRCHCHFEYRGAGVVSPNASKPAAPGPEPEPVVTPASTQAPPSSTTPISQLTSAEFIKREADRARARGFEVVENGSASILETLGNEERLKTAVACYDASDRKIYINEKANYWKDPVAHMKDRGARGILSTDSPEHAITHEMGHGEHHRAVGERYWDLHAEKFTDKQKASLEGLVSKYATTQPIEFVAEVYAGMSLGKEYPKAVMTLYRKLGGPKP